MKTLAHVVVGMVCATAGFTAGVTPANAGAEQSSAFLAGRIHYVTIAASDEKSPRNDTANVVELRDGALFVVWHKYRASQAAGSDFGRADIAGKISRDGGRTWGEERIVIPMAESDVNIQAPALVALPGGELLLAALRAHGKASSSMCLFRSPDQGKTWTETGSLWARSKGQWLQGGASSLVRLADGRLVLPFHGGTGDQGSQHNQAGCYVSDDAGRTWRRSSAIIDLPMRGAMEASVAELPGRRLLMSLRTQLGTVMMCESRDGAETWSLPWSSGLTAPESCTCLRRIGTSDRLLLIWNGCEFYEPKHHHFGQRNPLTLAVSDDAGRSWRRLGDIENDPAAEFTNLNCTFTSQGDAVITYWVCRPAFNRKSTFQNADLKSAVIPRAFWAGVK